MGRQFVYPFADKVTEAQGGQITGRRGLGGAGFEPSEGGILEQRYPALRGGGHRDTQ